MIDLSKKDRSRQNSIWVNDAEYKIKTSFTYWLNFEKQVMGKTIKSDMLEQFDYLYERPESPKSPDSNPKKTLFKKKPVENKPYIPDDREAGFLELLKFWRNEQLLPRDSGKSSSIRILDWLKDSERICEVFKRIYGIDLETEDIHWHKFLGLFYSYLLPLEKVIEARQYEKPQKRSLKQLEEYEDKIKRENREMWELESAEEKPVFKMR